MDRRRFRRAMRVLTKTYPVDDWSRGMTPFEILISTMLSQSTTVANERRGMEGLRAAFPRIEPAVLATASIPRIQRAIWHAGLARQKARRIRDVARVVQGEWGGTMDRVLARPVAEARAALMGLPGVGPKTADVVLAMAAGYPTFPVDTHIARIAKRWRLAQGQDYEAIRTALERWTAAEDRKAWHLALIAHGRALCTARRPRCSQCPVAADCDWFLSSVRGFNKGLRKARR